MKNTKKNMKKLSDLCIEKNGIQTGPFGSQLHKKDYVDIGTPIITVEHLGENRIIHKNVPKVSNKDKERLNKYWLKSGDIVFSRVGSVDRRSLIRKDEEGWLFSGRCLRVRPDPDIIDPEYLSWYFGLDSFKEYIRGIAVGATMPSLNTKLLSEIEIKYPPFPEQKAIADILSSLDDKIELNTRMNKTLEEMAQAIFTRWFVDFDFPFDFEKGEPEPDGKPYRSSGGKMVESEMGLIPEGWNVGTISDVASVNPESWSAKKAPEIIRYVDLANTKNGIIEQTHIYKYKEAPSRAKRILKIGDTIIGTVRPGNRSYALVSDNDLTGSTGFAVLRPNFKEYTEFLYIQVCSDKAIDYFAHIADGAAYPAINPSIVMNYSTILPNDKVVTMFHRLISPIYSNISDNTKQNQTLTSIRDSLLPKLMSGDLRVPDHMIEKYKETSPEPAGADG